MIRKVTILKRGEQSELLKTLGCVLAELNETPDQNGVFGLLKRNPGRFGIPTILDVIETKKDSGEYIAYYPN